MTPTTLRAIEAATLASILLRQSRARRKSSTPVADPSAPRDNPHGLPSGRPIASLMRATFRRMATETRAWLEAQPPGSIPKAPPSLAHHIKPLAKALAKLTLPYRKEAGVSILEGLGLASGWTPSPRANDDRAAFAAASIVATTEDELGAALDALRAGGDASSAKGLSSLLARAWDAIKGVFRRGEEVRAEAIGETEASEAVHAGAVEAVEVATAGGDTRPVKVWRVDGAPCEICVANAGVGPIPLGESFPGGANWAPQHVRCRCSISIADLPADRVRPRPKPYGPSPVKPSYPDNYSAADRRETDRLAAATLGIPDATRLIPGLVGAPAGAKVVVQGRNGYLKVEVFHPDFEATRYIGTDARTGKPYIRNDSFFVRPGAQGKGLGAEVFGRQVEQASGAGVAYIETTAAKGPKINGYTTWPRFGYDAPIPKAVRDALPAAFRDAKRVSDLMRTPEGRAAWKRLGVELDMKFSLREGSRNRLIWDAYRVEKESR